MNETTAKYRNGIVKVSNYVSLFSVNYFTKTLVHVMIDKKHFHLFTSLFLSCYWWCWTISNDAKCRY